MKTWIANRYNLSSRSRLYILALLTPETGLISGYKPGKLKATPCKPVLVPMLILLFVSSCSVFQKGELLVYDFDAGYKQKRLKINLPPGAVSETHDRDKNGILVRTFRYSDGAEFFIACHDLSDKPAISLDQGAENMTMLARIWSAPDSGVYANGTCWRRQARDGFVIGYDFVQPGYRESYDRAIHSMHITR